MVEVKLSVEVSGSKLAYILEDSMKKSLGKMGYKIKTSDTTETYYPAGSTKLKTIKVGRVIEASKELKNSNDIHWGWTKIYPNSGTGIIGMNYGSKPEITLNRKYSSFDLVVSELHIGRTSERYEFIEPGSDSYKEYESDVRVLIKELYKQLKISPPKLSIER